LGGGVDYHSQGVGLTGKEFLPKVNGAFGLEYMISNSIGVSVSSGIDYYTNDLFDGTKAGRYNDLGWGISMGVKLYLFKMKIN